MNSKNYTIMLEDVGNITGFFEDQPGGELCLALFFDICKTLIEEENIDGLESVVETVYTVCEMPRLWGDTHEGWGEFFVEMIEMQILHEG